MNTQQITNVNTTTDRLKHKINNDAPTRTAAAFIVASGAAKGAAKFKL